MSQVTLSACAFQSFGGFVLVEFGNAATVIPSSVLSKVYPVGAIFEQ